MQTWTIFHGEVFVSALWTVKRSAATAGRNRLFPYFYDLLICHDVKMHNLPQVRCLTSQIQRSFSGCFSSTRWHLEIVVVSFYLCFLLIFTCILHIHSATHVHTHSCIQRSQLTKHLIIISSATSGDSAHMCHLPPASPNKIISRKEQKMTRILNK